MAHAYTALRGSWAGSAVQRRTTGARYGLAQLSDGTEVFLVWNSSASRYELWRASGAAGAVPVAVRIANITSTWFVRPTTGTESQLVDLCVDDDDNIYVFGANYTQPYQVCAVTYRKQSGYVWSAVNNAPTGWQTAHPILGVRAVWSGSHVIVAAFVNGDADLKNLAAWRHSTALLQSGWSLASTGARSEFVDGYWPTQIDLAPTGIPGLTAETAFGTIYDHYDVVLACKVNNLDLVWPTRLWRIKSQNFGPLLSPFSLLQQVDVHSTARIRLVTKNSGEGVAYLVAGRHDTDPTNLAVHRYSYNVQAGTSGIATTFAADISGEWVGATSPIGWNWDALYDPAGDHGAVLYWDPDENSTIRRRTFTMPASAAAVWSGSTDVVDTNVGWGGTNTVLRVVSAPRISAWAGWQGDHEDTGDGGLLGDRLTQNTPPNIPVRVAPEDDAYQTPAAATGFWWEFVDPDVGDTEEAFQLRVRRKAAGAAWTYWDATANAFSATPVWSESTTSEYAPGVTRQTTAIPAGVLTNGVWYEWQVRSRDSRRTESGWSDTGTFLSGNPPDVVIDSAVADSTGAITVDWTYSDIEGDPQATWRVKVFASAGQVWPDGAWPDPYRFDPELWDTVWDSGVVYDRDDRQCVTGPLLPGRYVVFIQVREEVTNLVSNWTQMLSGGLPDEVVVDGWQPLAISAQAWQAGSRGPYADLTVIEPGNLLSAAQSSVESGPSAADWAAVSNCTLSGVTGGVHGSKALRMTASGSGTMICTTPTGLSGIPVVENVAYRLAAAIQAQDASRTCTLEAAWYNTAGTQIGSAAAAASVAAPVGAWVPVAGIVTAPAGAAYAAMRASVASAASGNRIDLDTISMAGTVSDDHDYQWELGPAAHTWTVESCDTPTGLDQLLVEGVSRPSAPPIPGAVALWPFDSDELAVETVGNSTTTYPAGTPHPEGVDGPFPAQHTGAARFSGTGTIDTVFAGTLTDDAVTVSVWFRVETPGEAGTLIQADAGAGDVLVEIAADGTITWGGGCDWDDWTLYRWHQAVWVASDAGCDLYIDGTLVVSDVAATTRVVGTTVQFGSGWPGRIGMCAVWDSALDSGQIAWLHAYARAMFADWQPVFAAAGLDAATQLVRDYTAPLNRRRFYRGVRE